MLWRGVTNQSSSGEMGSGESVNKARISCATAVIQKLIGWASADLVRLYDDTSQDEAIGKFFDENGIRTDIEQKSINEL